ncbi:hypothetical protein [Jannaschia marina]|uniref:hypothetical protein n=1 Tax=Jannaschia marina TaxID=2741674 RepID=UPI0015C8771B|nr:hypothetical protein [Jannaschia marina]
MAVLRFVYALYLRLTGLGLLLAAGGYFAIMRMAAETAAPVEPLPLWVPGALGALGLLLLVPWWLPGGMRRPARGRDLIWLAPHMAIAALYPKLEGPLYAGLGRMAQVPPEVAAQLRPVDPIWWLLPPAALMVLLVLPGMRRAGSDTSRPDPDDPAKAIPVEEAKPVPLPTEKKLPALGAAMKLYIAADWLMLRLMGLGLMATAYMMWTMIEGGRVARAEALAYGKEPMTAVYVYVVVGAILALPFLLPRRIARPHNVIYGLLKAVLLVGAAFVLIAPLNIAIVTFTPDIYHATLEETVPRLFKAICGVAVTSALLISFFRQLGGLPAVDYKGDPKVQMSSSQLHDLRKARMPGTGA